jgi:amino acid transporter
MSHPLFRTKNIDKILRGAETMADDPHAGAGLKRVLTLRDLTFFGIAAIIGAGSFSSLGQACYNGGPGVIVLFIICAIACGFTALCYSEFASRIPVAGSAYTYAYASFGELFAWIIGWALIMEYSIGNIYVAFSWSDYFTLFMSRIGVHIPDYLTCSYMEAHGAIIENANAAATTLTASTQQLIDAWNHAPMIGGLRLIFDMPALIICVLITSLVYVGVRESRNFSNVMVILKLCIIILVIAVGAYYVNPENWTPVNSEGIRSFMPNGFSGVMRAVSSVFFAYIGFDAISVMAEESKNPQRDLPRSMILSLVICTVVYILLTLVLTGVVSYEKFNNVGDPLAKIFEDAGNGWMQFLVSLAAVIAMTSVLLVFQMGQPRIWMSMSRDGLLPSRFEKIHKKYKTPSFATVVTGFVVGVPLLFTDKVFVLDFTSIATLFAFVLVCGGVLLIPKKKKVRGQFSIPYINGKIIFPAIVAAALIILQLANKNYISNLFQITEDNASLNISTIIFWVIMIALAITSLFKNWSLIPLLGLSSCLYLLTGMTGENWAWFGSWLVLGLIIYFMYGYRKSKLVTV